MGEKVLFADADGSTDFSDALAKFWEIMLHDKEDVLICGSRCHLRNESDSVVKVCTPQIANFLFIDVCFCRDLSSDYFS